MRRTRAETGMVIVGLMLVVEWGVVMWRVVEGIGMGGQR